MSRGGVADRRAAMTDLTGRSAELGAFEQALTEIRAGRPQVVMVDAEAGMGKTALLSHVGELAPEAHVVHVTCDEFERVLDYSLVDLAVGGLPETPASSVAAGRLLLAWLSRLQETSDSVVVLVDDVQWMDARSTEALRFAMRRLGVDRVLVVLARRPPVGDDPWSSLLADTRLAQRMVLPPLGTSDVVELARAHRHWDLSGSTAARLVAHTGGVPLLLQAYLQSAPGPDSITSPAELPVPSTARTAVLSMLGQVVGEGQLLLNGLAVLNGPTDRLTLGQLPGLDEPDPALSSVLDSGLVALDRKNETVSFVHALFRDVVYDRMELSWRRDLHRWAASHTTGDRALGHLVAAAVRPDADLCAALLDAARRARAAGLPELAASHALTARRMATHMALRDELLLDAVHDLLDADDLAAALNLRAAVEETAPGTYRSLTLGTLAHREGQVQTAQQLLWEAVGLAEDAGMRDHASRAAAELGQLYAAMNLGERVLEAASHLAPLGSSEMLAPDRPEAAQALSLRAVGLWEIGELSAALDVLADIRPQADPARWEPDLFTTRGQIRYSTGDLRGSVSDLNHAISLIGRWRPSLMRDRAHVQRSLSNFVLGEWDAAGVDASTACALAHSADRPWMIPMAHAMAAMVPAHRGDWAVAEDHLATARRGLARLPSAPAAALVAAATGSLALERGDFAAVRAALLPLWGSEDFSLITLVRSYRWVFNWLCEAAIRLGEAEEAELLLDEYSRKVSELPEAPGSAQLPWLRAQLLESRGDYDAARAGYDEELADASRPGSAPFTLARVLLTSGRLEREAGHRHTAIRQLSQARELLVPLRARPRLEEVDAELGRCGLRTTAAHPLQLTAREEDVATLVARGLTNKEIAAELFLTSKTVEYHLRNMFAKLNITNRRELRRRLGGGPARVAGQRP